MVCKLSLLLLVLLKTVHAEWVVLGVRAGTTFWEIRLSPSQPFYNSNKSIRWLHTYTQPYTAFAIYNWLCSLNAYRSAISSVHDRVDDMDVGKHPLMSRLLKEAFHARPPLPQYTRTWNVQVILKCMQQWGDTTSLSLKLSFKLVMFHVIRKN